VRGAELAAIENECFGIDHSVAGALWIETWIPAGRRDAIRRRAAAAATVTPARLALRGAA
jgi:hypothetical protein